MYDQAFGHVDSSQCTSYMIKRIILALGHLDLCLIRPGGYSCASKDLCLLFVQTFSCVTKIHTQLILRVLILFDQELLFQKNKDSIYPYNEVHDIYYHLRDHLEYKILLQYATLHLSY